MKTNNITKSELRGMIREWWYNTKKNRMTESRLRGMIREAVRQSLKEAENNGWVVEDDDAWEAYEFACDRMGKETVDNAIIRALSYKQLAECLAYIFRMYDFEEWNEYNSESEEPEYDEEY